MPTKKTELSPRREPDSKHLRMNKSTETNKNLLSIVTRDEWLVARKDLLAREK